MNERTGAVKGIIFNVTEMAVTEALGADAWDALLDAAEVSGAYSAIGDYPSSELLAISSAAAAHLGLTLDETLVWVGRNVVRPLAVRYPAFFEHATATDFLETLDSIIHREVRKLYAGAEPPRFSVERLGTDRLLVTYSSRRCMAALAEGMLQGTADFFGEDLRLERSIEMGDHGQVARFQCHFTAGAVKPARLSTPQ